MVDDPAPRRGQRRAAQESQAWRGNGEQAGKGELLGLFAVGQVSRSRREDRDLVRERRQRGQHSGAADDEAFVGLTDDACGVLLLACGRVRSRAVALGVQQRVRHDQVLATQAIPQCAGVVGVALVGLTEVLGSGGVRRHHAVHEVGPAAQHAAVHPGPHGHGLAPAPQIVGVAGLEVGHREPLVTLGVAELLGECGVELLVEQLGNGVRHAGEQRVIGNRVDALALDPDLPPVAQALQVLLAGSQHAEPLAVR